MLACDEWRERNDLHSYMINGVKRNVTIACDEWTEMEYFFLHTMNEEKWNGFRSNVMNGVK